MWRLTEISWKAGRLGGCYSGGQAGGAQLSRVESDRVRRSRATGTPSTSAADAKCCTAPPLRGFQCVFFCCWFSLPKSFNTKASCLITYCWEESPGPKHWLREFLQRDSYVPMCLLEATPPVDSADGEQQSCSRWAAPAGVARDKWSFFIWW